MSLSFALPETYKIVQVAPIAAATTVAYDTINCKNAHKVWFIINHNGANNTDLTLSLVEATAVGGSTTAVTATFPIWVDKDAGTTSDTLVKQTDAASYKIEPDQGGNELIVIEWDPVKFSDGYDSILLADTGGHASNNVNAIAIIATRFPQATPPSVIID